MIVDCTRIEFYIINKAEGYWRKVKKEEEDRVYDIFKEEIQEYLPKWKKNSSTPHRANMILHINEDTVDSFIVDDDEDAIADCLLSIKEKFGY